MSGLLSILFNILMFLVAFFVITFTVYMFNLDMKLMAAIHPWLLKIYDMHKRERKV